MLALKDRLKNAISCDSLTFGGNAFQSLLARNVKDRCINSRLKGGISSLVLSPRKLQGRSWGGGGESWGTRAPPFVGLFLNKQPTIFRLGKRHDHILAVKAIVEKPTFLKVVFL